MAPIPCISSGISSSSEKLQPITSHITIEGNGYTISGDNKFRIFDVDGGMLTVKNLTMTEGKGAIKWLGTAAAPSGCRNFMGGRPSAIPALVNNSANSGGNRDNSSSVLQGADNSWRDGELE